MPACTTWDHQQRAGLLGSRGISASFSMFVYAEGKLSDSPSKSQMALVADGKWSVKKPPAGRAEALKHQTVTASLSW